MDVSRAGALLVLVVLIVFGAGSTGPGRGSRPSS